MPVQCKTSDEVPVICIEDSIQYAAAVEMIKMLWLAPPSETNEAMIIAIEDAVINYEETRGIMADDGDILTRSMPTQPEKLRPGDTPVHLLSKGMETTAALFIDVTAAVLVNDGQHFVLVFTNPSGGTFPVAMPLSSLDGFKQVVDDLKLLHAGMPLGEIKQ